MNDIEYGKAYCVEFVMAAALSVNVTQVVNNEYLLFRGILLCSFIVTYN